MSTWIMLWWLGVMVKTGYFFLITGCCVLFATPFRALHEHEENGRGKNTPVLWMYLVAGGVAAVLIGLLCPSWDDYDRFEQQVLKVK